MGDYANLVCGWSWEENKQFELGLAVVDERDPNRWEAVAAMVGGKRSAEEVRRRYVILVEDLKFIESGFLDSKFELEEDHQPCLQVDCTRSLCWTDEDHNLFHPLSYLSKEKGLVFCLFKKPKVCEDCVRF